MLQFAKPNRSPTSAEQALKLIARTTALNRPTLPIMQSSGQALPGTSSSAAAPGEFSPLTTDNPVHAAVGTAITTQVYTTGCAIVNAAFCTTMNSARDIAVILVAAYWLLELLTTLWVLTHAYRQSYMFTVSIVRMVAHM